jgi:hypothetical protein
MFNFFHIRSSVEEAKVEACLEGVILTAKWSRQCAILETDCSTIIAMLRSGGGERMPWAEVLKEIQAVCALLSESGLRL